MSTQVTTNENTVNVTTSGQTVVVQAAGIQGPQGPTGADGAVQPTGSFAVTGSNSFVGDQIITGSLTISGSSTFTNIGPAIFSGSITATAGITGSFSGTATSASFAVTASHALFAVSASHEITFEVSSSHAQTADQAGNLFGTPSIVVNDITASGNISASGATITALTGSFNHIITDDDTIEFRNRITGVQTGRLKFDPTTGLNVQDSTGTRTKVRAGRGEFLSLEAGVAGFNSLGSITASVDISASGDIIANNLSGTNTGDQDLSNLVTNAQTASFVTNAQTASFAITGSDVIFGNVTASGAVSASGNITANRFDAKSTAAGGAYLISGKNALARQTAIDRLNINVDGAFAGGVSIGFQGEEQPAQSLRLVGNLTASGGPHKFMGQLFGDTQVIVNGDISASSQIVGNSFKVQQQIFGGTDTSLIISGSTFDGDNRDAQIIYPNHGLHFNSNNSDNHVLALAGNNVGIRKQPDDGNALQVSGSISMVDGDIFGATNITAFGNISASGDVFGVTGSFSHLVGNSPITVGDSVTFQQPITAEVIDTSFETFFNFESATAFTYIAPFGLTVNFTGSSTASMDVVGFVTASANTETFSSQQLLPITLNQFDKLKITPAAVGLFIISGSRTI
jgi:hypothetical protein